MAVVPLKAVTQEVVETETRSQGQLPWLFQYCENFDAVDALPYIDGMGADETAMVHQLVAEEMASMPSKNYLSPLPPPATPLCSDAVFEDAVAKDDAPLWLRSLELLMHKKPATEKVDLSRYELKASFPPGVTGDLEDYEKVLSSARVQLEHITTRALNLELMVTNGVAAWLKHVENLEQYEKKYRKILRCSEEEVQEVNKRRKLDQIVCGNSLRSVMRELEDTVARNQAVAQAVVVAEAELKELRAAAVAASEEAEEDVSLHASSQTT